ncbi:MAG TPA: right-handed parallel beta-helix repeat-containing protein [Gaiellaceae bacterium]|nr:right-handed parallel beta-helix repeat-containing protein [Gaiellaceae bacterium]
MPFNGTQHGNAIYYTNSSGTISGNTVSLYQKNGITAVNGSSVTISGNTVTGQGPVTYIAQNGIEVGSGASATVSGNTVSDNAYSGTNDASLGGILVFGGPCFGSAYTTGVSVTTNTLTNNDVGIFLYNADATCLATSPTKTQNKAVNNTITNSNTTNVSGNGYPNGYQAGISDFGNKDNIVNNKISGDGYNPLFQPTPASLYTTIDTTGSQAAHVNNNK